MDLTCNEVNINKAHQDSKIIELPNIGEMLLWPFFYEMDADTFRKLATEDQKRIFDQAPLKNDRKYVTVVTWVQYLSPKDEPVFNKVYEHEWHVDGWLTSDRSHLMLSDCSALTDFNITEKSIKFDKPIDHLGFTDYLNKNSNDIPLVAQEIKPRQFITFDYTNPHKTKSPKEHEFRLVFRILESDTLRNVEDFDKYRPKSSALLRDRKYTKNVEQEFDKIIIHNTQPYRYQIGTSHLFKK